MRKTLVNQSVSSTVMTFILLITGLVAITAPAQAATPKPKPVIVKQGTACTKTGTKITSNKVTYTCGTNPATTSTKLVWILPICNASQVAFLSANEQYTKYETSSASVLSQLQTTLASYQNALTVAQTAQADSATKVYVISTDPKTKLPLVTAVGVTAAIAAVEAKIVADQAALAAAKDAESQRVWTLAIRSRTKALSIMNRQVTTIANQITQDQDRIATFTAQIESSKASQTRLLGRLQNTINSAKKTRDKACKLGL